MKRFRMISRKYVFFLAALFVFAAGTLYADFRSGLYTQTGPARIQRESVKPASTDASYDAGEYPLYYPELAPGDGKEAVETYCELCHSPRYITMQPPLPAQAWAAEVNKMRKTYGAAIPDDDAQRIIQYLGSHYTPETRKR
jgi:hypothetical protein